MAFIEFIQKGFIRDHSRIFTAIRVELKA